jgi:malonate transporter MadM subunit
MEIISKFFEKNGLIFGFLIVGLVILLAELISKKLLKSKIPGAAIAIIIGLVLAYYGGTISHGQKGIADVKLFAGMEILGGNMFRDFAIVATAMGASILLMKKSGWIGLVSLILGITISFSLGLVVALAFGYTDSISLTTIGAGACTYIVGPVTGNALGASSDVIALSIAAGVVKAICVAISTPLIAKKIGLNNPETAMVFGGIMGTNAGVMAGLAATDPKLVPYGALTATFYTGLGCLLCPSVLFIIVNWILS